MSRLMPKVLGAAFILLLAALPFAEWRFIGLPLHGRPWRIDFDGNLSASAFDFVLVILLFACIVNWRRLSRIQLRDARLVPWLIGVILVPILYASLHPKWPWLTPSQPNVIDTRAFTIHLVLGCLVLLVVATTPLVVLRRWATVFLAASTAGTLLLVYSALIELPYFRFHYPFNVATTIAFPFPSQGPAAIFFSVCLLGALGVGSVTGNRLLLIGAPCVLLAAVALTGSRAGFFLVSIATLGFVCLMAANSFPLNPWKNEVFRRLIVGSGCALLAIMLLSDKPPVQRAFHLIRNLAQDPLTLLAGEPDSPRRQLWSSVVSRESLGAPEYGTEYALALVSVRGGCFETSTSSIGWLQAGVPYLVRLTVDSRSGVASLDAYEDQGRTRKGGSLTLNVEEIELRDFLALGANSARSFTVAKGELKNYRLAVNGVSRPVVLSGYDGAEFYEDPFSGGVTPVIDFTAGAVRFDANSRLLNGHVISRGVLGNISKIELEYELQIDRVQHADVLEKPPILYVGFFSNAPGTPRDLETLALREGLLIQHLRKTSVRVRGIYGNELAEELASLLRSGRYVGKDDKHIFMDLRNKKHCGADGKLQLSGLWSPPIGFDIVDRGRSELSPQVVPRWTASTDSELSIVTEKTVWSSGRHLQQRGSTHNVFLDWYRYVGPGQAAVFVLFILSLNLAMATFVWKMRRSAYFPLALATMLQLLVITGALYAQPNLFLKYYWVVFGMASGLMVNQQLVRSRVLGE